MWSLAGRQAIDQLICCFWPGLRAAGWSAAVGLSHVAGWSAALGLCVGQLASASGVHPPEVSGVGPQSANLGARNWACLLYTSDAADDC